MVVNSIMKKSPKFSGKDMRDHKGDKAAKTSVYIGRRIFCYSVPPLLWYMERGEALCDNITVRYSTTCIVCCGGKGALLHCCSKDRSGKRYLNPKPLILETGTMCYLLHHSCWAGQKPSTNPLIGLDFGMTLRPVRGLGHSTTQLLLWQPDTLISFDVCITVMSRLESFSLSTKLCRFAVHICSTFTYITLFMILSFFSWMKLHVLRKSTYFHSISRRVF